MSYYTFLCKKCGRWSSKEVRSYNSAVFKCPYCRHSEKIKKANFGLSLIHRGPFDNPNEAALNAQNANGEKIRESAKKTKPTKITDIPI